jgi:hypothetical protein
MFSVIKEMLNEKSRKEKKLIVFIETKNILERKKLSCSLSFQQTKNNQEKYVLDGIYKD